MSYKFNIKERLISLIHPMRKIAIFLCSISISLINAQAVLLTEEVKNLFQDHSNGIWISHYYGTTEDGTKYILNLGYDNQDYRGILNNLNSNEKIFLEGKYDPSILKCIGYDSLDQLHYEIIGERKDSSLVLDLLSTDKKHGRRIYFLAQARDQFRILDCAPNSYCKIFQDKNIPNIRLNLQRNEDESISGNLYISAEEDSYSIIAKCKDPNCNKISGIIYDKLSQKAGSLQINHVSNASIHLDYILKNNSFNYDLNLMNHLKFSCISFKEIPNPHVFKTVFIADKNYLKFNQEIISFIKNDVINNLKKDTTKPLFFYYDNELYSEDFISGTYKYILPDEDSIRYKNINYYIRNDKEITLEDFFDKEFNTNQFFKDAIAFKIEHLLKNKETDFQNWLKTIDLNNWTLREEGFVFHSNFSPKYGFTETTVPFTELAGKIKKNNLTKRLLK
jgi:hypothetical protein